MTRTYDLYATITNERTTTIDLPGLVATVLNAVHQFRGETEQRDDATLMVLRYVDPFDITLEPSARASTS